MIPGRLAALLPEAMAIARAAGQAILEHAPSAATARKKADASPVTDADEAAEAVILAGLARLSPGIKVVSEERVSAQGSPFAGPATPRFYWLVDPLDGTREFVARRADYSVNLALVADGFPVLGALHSPVRDVGWGGCGPGTAVRVDAAAAPRSIRARVAPTDGVVVVSSRSHGDDAAVAAFLDDRHVAQHRRLGSALKFALLAEGEADLYPRFGPTMEWDTAAGQAILEAAGGRVETLAGARLACGRPGFRNPDFFARGATS